MNKVIVDFANDPRMEAALALVVNLQEMMDAGMDDLSYIYGHIDVLRQVLLMDLDKKLKEQTK